MEKEKILKKLKNKKILVLKGGWSSEKEISLKTAKNIEKVLKDSGLKVIGVDLKKDFLRKIMKIKPDICFIALHGCPGEDGTVQAILDFLKIPYTGSDFLASALALNKIYSKIIFEKYKIPTPQWIWSSSLLRNIPGGFSFPLVIKPSSEGSTIGISIVKNKKEFILGQKKAFTYSKQILIEKYIKGKELTVGILEDKPLPVIEIIPLVSSFYDYKSKYQKGGSKHIIPAQIPKNFYKKAQKLALLAHKALGCRCFSRVDMRMEKSGKIYVLEVNTIPGMTSTSLLPEAASFVGIDFSLLILKILNYTLNA